MPAHQTDAQSYKQYIYIYIKAEKKKKKEEEEVMSHLGEAGQICTVYIIVDLFF
jgi:hypothetical protein